MGLMVLCEDEAVRTKRYRKQVRLGAIKNNLQEYRMSTGDLGRRKC